jgi:hypothetical protein
MIATYQWNRGCSWIRNATPVPCRLLPQLAVEDAHLVWSSLKLSLPGRLSSFQIILLSLLSRLGGKLNHLKFLLVVLVKNSVFLRISGNLSSLVDVELKFPDIREKTQTIMRWSNDRLGGQNTKSSILIGGEKRLEDRLSEPLYVGYVHHNCGAHIQ